MKTVTLEHCADGQRRNRQGHIVRTKEERGRLVELFQQSGMTQREFCDHNGIAYSTFYGWLNEKRRVVTPDRSTEPHPVAFAQLKVSQLQPKSNSVEVRFPNGVVLSCCEASELLKVAKILPLLKG